MDEKLDKYEQLLAKIDWRAPHPPKGYQYGVGRGAKGFVTTAELTTGTGTTAKLTRDEHTFFAEMERLEERSRRLRSGADDVNATGDSRARGSGIIKGGEAEHDAHKGGAPTKTKLSLEDLATLDAGTPPLLASSMTNKDALSAAENPVAYPAPSTSVVTSAPGSSSVSLIVRSARTEEGEVAEEHIFAEERVLTASDVLKGKVSAMQAGLHNVLAMGSPEEQTTWITHARAYREMGMARRAYLALVEGCALTGKKGKRIWEERLRFLAKDSYAGRRRVLEDAVAACPMEEQLWLSLLECVPPLERVPCLQRAVLACPTSEQLWLRLVQFVPSPKDQRALLQKALQHTPSLPLLWARLARLEPLQTGKEMFRAAAARYPSLALIIEAAKYVEWHALPHNWAAARRGDGAATKQSIAQATLRGTPQNKESTSSAEQYLLDMCEAISRADVDVHGLVRTAQDHYLSLSEAGSRQAWLSQAVSLVQVEGEGTSSRGEEAQPVPATESTAAEAVIPFSNLYIITAAHMFLCVVDPKDGKGLSSAVPSTWLEDLVALLPADAIHCHPVQCALWYTWLHIVRRPLLGQGGSTAFTKLGALGGVSMASQGVPRILACAIASAPHEVVHDDLNFLFGRGEAGTSQMHGEGESVLGEAPSSLLSGAVPCVSPNNEDEEEELGKPLTDLSLRAPRAPSSSPSTRGADTPSDSTVSPVLPPPLIVTLVAFVDILTTAAAVGTDVHPSESQPHDGASPTVSEPGSSVGLTKCEPVRASLEFLTVEAPLAIAHALRQRRNPSAALSVLDFFLDSAASPTGSIDLRLVITRAELLAAMNDLAAADACLVKAIDSGKLLSSASRLHLLEKAWVKLAVLRRSQGLRIEPLLQDAVTICPRSWRLWLMMLDEKRRSIQGRLRGPMPAVSIALADLLRQDEQLAHEVRELRILCRKVLSSDHCENVAAVWVFVAARVEAALLQNSPAARALLTDALSACAPSLCTSRARVLGRAVTPQELERQAGAMACVGVAQAKLDALYGTPGQALETVQEVLHKLPKTREGSFAMPHDDALGELLALFISLEPPASRGRAASQVMRQWKSREPLVLCAVAQLYFAAGQYARALDQAKKAVQVSKGRCGDAVGLLWRLAESPPMQPLVRVELSGQVDKGNSEAGESGKRAGVPQQDDITSVPLPSEQVQRWVFSIMYASADAGDTNSTASLDKSHMVMSEAAAADPATAATLVVPNSGPLWIEVAKAEDPSNVTLLGYRRPILDMLREVANRIPLRALETTSASPGSDAGS